MASLSQYSHFFGSGGFMGDYWHLFHKKGADLQVTAVRVGRSRNRQIPLNIGFMQKQCGYIEVCQLVLLTKE
jgi:hypothetical protein